MALWKRHLAALQAYEASGLDNGQIDLTGRLAYARQELARVSSTEYLEELTGTIGAEPCVG